ncbi:MAG: alpha/beta fold hydrolase [Myxococcaceae bacterium]|nr:alpha/beta fold hydrolase [Myxococcaceae bacterium]
MRGAARLPFGFERWRLRFEPDALHKVATADGCSVALARYHPRGRRRFVEPVVLCHGLGANRFTFDFDERFTLARRLAERGFEAWILELRGRGEAGRAHTSSFDRQVDHDVLAALRTVREAGAKEVLWVGHSKGGLLAFAHVGRNPAAPIRAIAAIGSPTTYAVQKGLKPFARLVRPFLSAPSIPLESLAKLAVVVPPPDSFMRYLVCPENLDEDTRKKALVNVGADVAGGVGRQFLDWITTGRWQSGDRKFDYERGLAAVRVPTLLIAGACDLLAPPDAVRHTARYVRGPTEVVVAGREAGFRADYGHGDLMLGRHAPEELYPRVMEFLERHATPANGDA